LVLKLNVEMKGPCARCSPVNSRYDEWYKFKNLEGLMKNPLLNSSSSHSIDDAYLVTLLFVNGIFLYLPVYNLSRIEC